MRGVELLDMLRVSPRAVGVRMQEKIALFGCIEVELV
jgi:hypothetical protein